MSIRRASGCPTSAVSIIASCRAFTSSTTCQGTWPAPAGSSDCRRARGTQRFGRISFATVKEGTAAELLEHLAGLNSTLSAVGAGSVHGAVQAVFDKRATTSGVRVCRATQLDKQISALTKQSVIRVGATATHATNRDAGLAAMYNALCTPSGTPLALQNAIKQYATAQLGIRDGMSLAVPSMVTGDRAGVLAAVTRQAIGALVSRCGLLPGPVLSFLYDGTLPTGKTGDNLLTGSCIGTPSQVAVNLGLGSTFTGQTLDQARNRYNDCLVDSFETPWCNDPRAAGAPDENANPAPPPASAPKNCFNIDEGFQPCTAEEMEALSAEEAKRAATADLMNAKAIEDRSTPPRTGR